MWFNSRMIWLSFFILCNIGLSQCLHFDCAKDTGQYADSSSCRRYFRCNHGIANLFFCASGTLYDGARHECVNRHEDGIKCGPQPSTEAPITTPDPNQATKCDRTLCKLPECFCTQSGTEIPGGLTKEQTPQMIMLTFDGAVNSLNFDTYQTVFLENRTNPNGCPIRGTFFVSHDYSDYAKVETLYSKGHEFAMGSISRRRGLEDATVDAWVGEMVSLRNILSNFASVNPVDVIGMRAPHIKPGRNAQFQTIFDYNFLWDSSFAIPPLSVPVWPYTLDYEIPHECRSGTCPTSSFPGIWEIPMNSHYRDLTYDGGYCPFLDQCVLSFYTEEDVLDWLKEDFHRHYNQNRAPYMMSLSINWFQTPAQYKGLLRFIDYTLTLPEVYYTTMLGVLQWMSVPTPVDEMKVSFPAFECLPETLPPPPCNLPSSCPLSLTIDRTNGTDVTPGTRYMVTCQDCPNVYPWVNDAAGRGGNHRDVYEPTVYQ